MTSDKTAFGRSFAVSNRQSTMAKKGWSKAFEEPVRQRLGQCRDGELLLEIEKQERFEAALRGALKTHSALSHSSRGG